MEITQSFLLSITRVRLSLYEQRILTKIVEHGQTAIQGYSPLQYKHIKNPFNNEVVKVPIRYILSDKTKDYNKVIEACLALMNRKFEFYDPTSKTYYADTCIHNVKHVKGSGEVSFMVSRILFEVMLNFQLGYKKYDLEEALSLPTPYAVRLYVLLNGQTKPIIWDIEQLKKMFGVEDKYTQTRDFIKKVIEPARVALVNNRCNNFTYSRVTEGRKVVALRFFPVKVTKEDSEMYGELTREQLTQIVACRTMLANDMGFTWKEINANKTTTEQFAKLIGAVDRLYSIMQRAQRKGMDKGYIIAAMKSEYKHASRKEIQTLASPR